MAKSTGRTFRIASDTKPLRGTAECGCRALFSRASLHAPYFAGNGFSEINSGPRGVIASPQRPPAAATGWGSPCAAPRLSIVLVSAPR